MAKFCFMIFILGNFVLTWSLCMHEFMFKGQLDLPKKQNIDLYKINPA